MAEALWITLILIVVAIGGILGFLYFVQITQTRKRHKPTTYSWPSSHFSFSRRRGLPLTQSNTAQRKLIFILAIVSVSMARSRLFARLRRRFARWTLFHGGRSALCAIRCQNRVKGSVTG